MEVEYSLAPDDIVALHLYLMDNPADGGRAARRRPSAWIFLAYNALLTALMIPVLLESEWSFQTVLLGLLIVGGIVFQVLYLFRRRLLVWWVSHSAHRLLSDPRNARHLAFQRVTVTPEALIADGEAATTTYQWSGIEKIGVTGNHAFFFVGPKTAQVVPRRAFASESDFLRFVTLAGNYWDAACEGPPPSVLPADLETKPDQ